MRWLDSIIDSMDMNLSKLQYVGHLMQRANSLKKMVMWGKIEGK